MTTPRKTTRLRGLLGSGSLEFLLEAHNAVSARIAEEAGFPGVWASGLTLAAALGVRDSNEATWTQVLEQVEFMTDATGVPILLDGNTGHGDFNTLRRFVTKCEQRGVAGLCIEDKLFPKTNSFLRGEQQPLADAEEFCGKIKAALDARRDDDFVLIARTDALIAGRGLEEALRRAEAYRRAGAHAVIVHSKSPRPDEVFAFLREWAGRLPVVLIPTKYYATPTAAFREHGVAAVIWANHQLRASVRAMQENAARIRREESVAGLEDEIAPLGEIFRLQGDAELQDAERRYRCGGPHGAQAIILAATRGEALGPLTADRPKTLLKIGATTILERLVTTLRQQEVTGITVVAGYKKELVELPGVRRVDNDDYATTGELASLAVALADPAASDGADTLVAFGDILFRGFIATLLLRDPADIVIAVDSRFREDGRAPHASDYVRASRPPSPRDFLDDDVRLEHAEVAEPRDEFHGEWIGLLKLSAAGLGWARDYVVARRAAGDLARLQMTDLLNHFVATGRGVRIHYVQGHWIDVDSLVDLNLAQRF